MIKKLKVIICLLLICCFVFLPSCYEENTGNNNNTNNNTNNNIVNNTQLATPKLILSNNIISWNKIVNATKYEIYLDNELFAVTTEISIEDFSEFPVEGIIHIVAIDENENYLDSEKSNKIDLALITRKPVVIPKNINLFMINDTHGSFYSNNEPGLEKVSSVIKDLEAKEGDLIKIANGDIFQGSYVSNVLYGRPLIEGLNKLDYDAFVIGNHEFDWGLDKIKAYKDGDLSNGEANFPFLGANIIDKTTNEIVDFLEPYTIVESNEFRVGIIGLIGESHESSILAEHVANYDFIDPVPVASYYSEYLREQEACDVIVIAIHDYNEYFVDEMAKFDENAEVDAILCAHTHQKINTSVQRVDNTSIPVVQNYHKNVCVSHVNLTFDEKKELASFIVQQIDPENYESDSSFDDLIDQYQSYIDEGNKVLGSITRYLSKSTLGAYAVNSMDEYFNLDFSIMNTGGIRASIDAGEITVSDVFETLPFNNKVILVTMSGKQLKSVYERNKNYLYISSSYNKNNIDDNKMYQIGVIDYVFYGKYYSEFREAEYKDSEIVLRDLLIQYIDNMY